MANKEELWLGSNEVGDVQLWQGQEEYLPENLPSWIAKGHTLIQAGGTDKCSYEVRFSTTEDATHQYFVLEFPSAMGSTYSVTRMRIEEEV